MSSTNETQGKDQIGWKLSNLSPERNKNGSNTQETISYANLFLYKHRRFQIKKYQDFQTNFKDWNSKSNYRNNMYDQYIANSDKNAYMDHYENQDSEKYQSKFKSNVHSPSPCRNILGRVQKITFKEKRETEINIVHNLEQVLKNQQNLSLSSQSNGQRNKEHDKYSENNEQELSRSDDSYFRKSLENGKIINSKSKSSKDKWKNIYSKITKLIRFSRLSFKYKKE